MQVVDYGLALKSDNGNLLFSHLIKLLRLNMVLVQKNAYSRSIMMQLLNLMHQREHNLPSWQMFSKSTAVFNEEVGEHSFAILSRLVLGGHHQVLLQTHGHDVRPHPHIPCE